MTNVNKMNEIILDVIDYYKINDDRYLPKMLEVVIIMIRETEIPDAHIIDINAMLGCYIDEIEFFEKDYKKILIDFFELYQKYIDYCFILNETIILNNLEKLRNYESDDSIFNK